MRAGGCTVQQTLSAEAAAVVKHAVGLAKRRGHGQVTPLHVAITMLVGSNSGGSLLRRACLQSHSHPLQCRALELCFNVALNRLPASGPMVQGMGPSLSNALVAAFKRAQANQRRGCVEHQQQQPLLAVKVEMEQLIISILDDPSVSRVMREAGFSSTQVKANLEDSISSAGHMPRPKEIAADAIPLTAFWHKYCARPAYASNNNNNNNNNNNYSHDNPAFESGRFLQIGGNAGAEPRSYANFRDEDVRNVVQILLSKRRSRNAVIVGECLVSAESVVKEVMVRVERGDLLESVEFINPQFSCLSGARNRDYVEQKLADLRRMIKRSCSEAGGAIVYLGDLRWAVPDPRDDRAAKDGPPVIANSNPNINNYCPVEHITMELGRILVSCHADCRRLWLLATATYQTYIRCQMRQPSLETLWGLHPVPVPAGSLGFSLNPRETSQDVVMTTKDEAVNPPAAAHAHAHAHDEPMMRPFVGLRNFIYNSDHDELDKQLDCCAECSAKFEREVHRLSRMSELTDFNWTQDSLINPPSTLPSWLRHCQNDNRPNDPAPAQAIASGETVRQLYGKWNRICRSIHFREETQINVRQQQGPTEIQFDLSSNSSSCDRFRLNTVELMSRKSSSDTSQTHAWASSTSQSDQTWSVIGFPFHLCPTKAIAGTKPWDGNLSKIKGTHQFWTNNAENGQYETSTREFPPDIASIPLGIQAFSPQRHSGSDLKTVLALGRSIDGQNICSHNMPSMDTSPPNSMLSEGSPIIFGPADTERILNNNEDLYNHLDAQSFKKLCRGLEGKLECQSQSQAIPAIATTILQCRSGMKRKQGIQATWLLFLGPDRIGKLIFARAIADIVFGSEDKLMCIGMNGPHQGTANADLQSMDHDHRAKTAKCTSERLMEAIRLDPHSVILLEEIDQSDTLSIASITRAMETGDLVDSYGEQVALSDAIIIMTSALGSKCLQQQFNGTEVECTPAYSPHADENIKDDAVCQPAVGSPCKRKAGWDISLEDQNNSNSSWEKRNRNSSFRQLNIALDLNLSAEENETDYHVGDREDKMLQKRQVLQYSCAYDDHHHQCYIPPEFFKSVDKSVMFNYQKFDNDKLAKTVP